jgi:pentatricopeptide repeat protein
LEHGLQLLGLMQRRGIQPDAILFNSILDGCAHKQMRSLTEMVLKDMQAAGIAPSNFTLSILVKLYGRCNDLEMAFQVVDTYPQKSGFELNAQVYTCLMSACIANGELSRAIDVYDRMTKAGCASDAKTYQTLLSGCLRHGDLNGATKLVDDALKRDPPLCLDREIVESVLFMVARRGRSTDLGIPLLDRLQSAGMSISDRLATPHGGAYSIRNRHACRLQTVQQWDAKVCAASSAGNHEKHTFHNFSIKAQRWVAFQSVIHQFCCTVKITMSQATTQQCLVCLRIACASCLGHPVIHVNCSAELTIGNASRHQTRVHLGIELESRFLRVCVHNLESHLEVIAPAVKLHKDRQSEIRWRNSSCLHVLQDHLCQ